MAIENGRSPKPVWQPTYDIGYTAYSEEVEGQRAHGGVMTMIRNNAYAEREQVDSNIQNIIIKMKKPINLTIINVYQPDQSWDQSELAHLIDKQP
ncbi:hypothetical protein O3M35_010086 [Rhynocoris fuscipes]|uniref:Uncharacterized protein n=1 Tax=Rhynocoris fuscipes TaxID=488301 RepID=A0AAW1D335_9HEMI